MKLVEIRKFDLVTNSLAIAQGVGQGGIPLCLKIAQQPIFERYTQ